MPPTTTHSSSKSSSDWATWVLIGLGILIFIGSLILLFLIGRHFYAKRQQKLAASKTIKKRSKKTKEKMQKPKASKDSVQTIKSSSQNLLQQPPSTQQCSSSAAADDNEKIKKSNEKINKRRFKEPPSLIKETTAEEGNESLKLTIEQKPDNLPLDEVSAKGDDEDEVEEPIDIKKLNEAEKGAEKVQQIRNKKAAAAVADSVDTEEEAEAKKKQEKFVKDKIECAKKVKEMFEIPEWDKKHMPSDCDYKLFMASSSMLRFCIMEYLKAHADQILLAHGYKISEGRAEVPPTAFEWLRSSEITENDEFLKSRAWMLENWSIFKRSPSSEWSYYSNMEVTLLYMTSMKDCITEPEVLDRVLRQTLQKAVEYFTVTPKKDWQLKDHPMKVMARIFKEGKDIDLAAAAATTVSVENGEGKN